MSIADEIRDDSEKGARRIEAEYKTRLCAIAANLGLDWSEAEALVYNTIDEAVKSIDRYEERSQFFPWLVKIMVNIHGKMTRRKSHERVEYASDVPDVPSGSGERPAGESVIEAVDGEMLKEAIELLPREMKEAVVLHYFMDMPILKVAKILSVPVGTVKARLHYARVVLAKRLKAGKIAAWLGVICLTALGAWAAVKFIPRTYYWRPGSSMARYDEPSNWSTEGLAGAPAKELPGADASLYGSGNYAFDISGDVDRTLFGWNTPEDWDNHYLVVANGALRFCGDVSTHTGEVTIEDGGELTFLKGSTYTPAIFSEGKWTTRVKKGGVFNLFGSFRGYSYRIIVEEGARATLNPQYWGGTGASEQADNLVENRGELNLPRGLVWLQGGGSAERYSVFIRQVAGRLNIGGRVAKAPSVRNMMKLGIELSGGEVCVSGDVSFAADSAVISGDVRFALADGARLDLTSFVFRGGSKASVAGRGLVLVPEAMRGHVSAAGGVEVRYGAGRGDRGEKVLRGGETLEVAEDLWLPNGIVTLAGADGALPTIHVAKGAVLAVPGDTRFGNVRLKVEGTLAASSEGDLVLGYAGAGEETRFAVEIDGGTVSNAFGNIDFFSPDCGGTVRPAGASRLDGATLWTDADHAFNFGRNNPEDARVAIAIRRTVLPYRGGTYYIAGGVSLDFADGARLYRKDAALEKADLIVKGAARLYFGPGTDLHYGAAANAFGSVGNGGLSFIPSVDGYPALVLDGATFWYHHPNTIRGACRAVLCATNATYEVRALSWNYTNPFKGFRSVDVAGRLRVRSAADVGKLALDGIDDPTDIRLPADVPLTGGGVIVPANDLKPQGGN